jgi:hypothetical protein
MTAMTAARNGKTGSRNPANKPTSVSAWKKSVSQAPPVQLPSGNYMRLKKVGLQTLVKIGIMPNSLMSIVMKSADKGIGKTEVNEIDQTQMEEILLDPKKVAEIGQFMDRMVCFVAQEPEVYPAPEVGVERDPELLYADDIDDEDKSFIFQLAVGGTSDVETFREEFSSSVGSLRGGKDVELPPK